MPLEPITAEARRDACIRRVLAHEGGYTNHPDDPGGPTNFGITIYDYHRYAKPAATADDVRRMQIEEAILIYRAKYWDAQKCSDLPAGVDYAVFDYGVNSGIGRSGRILRRFTGLPDTSSMVTDEVVAAAKGRFAGVLVVEICDERLKFLQSLRTWPVFGDGWGRRVAAVKAVAIGMAQGAPSDDAPPSGAAPGRAIAPDKFARIRALQQHLADAGFDPGAIDGDLGARTIKAFQRSRGLAVDGVAGPKTGPLLDAALAAIKPLAPAA